MKKILTAAALSLVPIAFIAWKTATNPQRVTTLINFFTELSDFFALFISEL